MLVKGKNYLFFSYQDDLCGAIEFCTVRFSWWSNCFLKWFFQFLMSCLCKLKYSKRKGGQEGDLSSFQNNLYDFFLNKSLSWEIIASVYEIINN